MPTIRAWIRVWVDAINAGVEALKERSERKHDEAAAAHKAGDASRASVLRAEADRDHAFAKEIQRALRDEDGWLP